MAAYGGKLAAVKVLIDFGAQVNSTSGVRGLTPLHACSMRGHVTVAKALLRAGADVTIRDRYGRRPVDWAAKRGYTELAHELRTAAGTSGGAAAKATAGGAKNFVEVAPAPPQE